MKRHKKDSLSVPLNFLLGCSERALGNFELAKLSAAADLRKELHVILDRVIDETSQAALAAWFRQADVETLKHALENPEDVLLWAKERIRDGQRSQEELVPRTLLAPGEAHKAASLRYQERNIAEGKCCDCTQPLARGSVRFCETHLASARARYKPKNAKGARPGSIAWLYEGVFESSHGKMPGTLTALADARERLHQTTEREKLLYSRVADQLGMTKRHVRAVALGQRRSETVLAAITKEIEQMATGALAALAGGRSWSGEKGKGDES